MTIIIKERSSNLELYRILVMLLIIAHHYVVNSGLCNEMDKNILSDNTLSLVYLEHGVKLVLIALF